MRRVALFAAAAALLVSGFPAAGSASETAPGEAHGFIRVSSGVELRYSVKTPTSGGPFPTIMLYDPYYAGTSLEAPLVGFWRFFVPHGYAVIGVNIRGSGCSTGRFSPPEASAWGKDGAEVVEWIARQPWSNGRVGMAGASFPGISQLGVAGFNPPHLRAIAPFDAIGDWYRDIFYPGGIRNVAWPAVFGALVQPQFAAVGVAYAAVKENERKCGALSPDQQVQNTVQNYAFEAPEHPFYDEFWAATANTRARNINVPALACQSWQDSAVGSRSAELYTLWGLNPATTWFIGTSGQHGACLPSEHMMVRFMDRFVKGEDNGWEKTPHLTLGYDVPIGYANPPYERQAGPPAVWFSQPAGGVSAIRPVTLYLHGDGRLDTTPSSGAEPDASYQYPLPSSSSGQFLMGEPGETSGWQVYNAPGGSVSYTTPKLAHDLEVFGPASADLWMSSTATDTDVQVTLTEVRPDGQEQWLQRGWLRLSHRKLDLAQSTEMRPYHTHRASDAAPLRPGEPVLARIEVMPFAHVFRAGSSLRFTIEAPTGLTIGNAFDFLKTPATNTVHHRPGKQSRLVLGTIPGGTAAGPLSVCNTVSMEPCRANALPVPSGALAVN